MWYEILPGFAIMTACLIIPGVATSQIHKLMNNGKEKRVARVPWHWYMMARDERLSGTGEHYVTKGLENIH
ncbi:NADH dehydrogenase [ubiquinone] 1 alpha subcomplex subunit 1 [Scomber japonicus]|uniref:NADH dehydrogenase [ubiquinone] 1 alpha subcomplex subunit 1 n=1 Tax=Scomber japonicus TaxID=13676 RepID=UPI002304F86B|nr:NADH dehydrogenase [ubiquinone] 1 alpha subcomplex subunit 1 [Scomber japonicus]